MKVLRALVVVAVVAGAAFVGYRLFLLPSPNAGSLGVYYVKPDGDSLVKWNVSVSPKASDVQNVAFYATAQAVAGPAPDTDAVRFPVGTIVRAVRVKDETATIDLGGTIVGPQDGSLAESGEFKALVYTLTGIPGIAKVQVEINGARVATLPGGHLELDEALTRKSW